MVEVAKKPRPDVKVFYQLREGKGEALRHGIKGSTGDIIVTVGEYQARVKHQAGGRDLKQ
jgi:hypothetical protein